MHDNRDLVQYVTLWNNTKCNIVILNLMISYMGHGQSPTLRVSQCIKDQKIAKCTCNYSIACAYLASMMIPALNNPPQRPLFLYKIIYILTHWMSFLTTCNWKLTFKKHHLFLMSLHRGFNHNGVLSTISHNRSTSLFDKWNPPPMSKRIDLGKQANAFFVKLRF